MALVADETTSICKHCQRSIPLLNYDLHYAHCSRNLQKCNVCGDMIPTKHAEEHYRTTHAHVTCSLCGQEMEPGDLEDHESQNCPLRMVTCEYCEFPLPALDLSEHQEICGNRTEYCEICKKYIRLSNRSVHEATCTGISGGPAEPSRETWLSEPEGERSLFEREFPPLGRAPPQPEREPSAPETEEHPQEPRASQQQPQRRPLPPGQRRSREDERRKKLLFTVVVTGVAVVLGSFFFQKKVGSTELK